MAKESARGLTKKELANIAGYTYRRIYEIDRGLPPGKKLFVETEDGKYDLPSFVQRWVDYNVAHEVSDDTDLEAAKTKHEKVKTQKTELEVARLRGELIDVQDVRRLWADITTAVTQNMMRLPKKIAPLLVMMENEEAISVIIDDEVRRTLEAIADTPLPSYVEDAPTDGNEDREM